MSNNGYPMTDDAERQLAARMAELARQVAAPSSVEAVLSGVTETALEIIPGVDAAGVLLIAKGGKFETHAGTAEIVHELDSLQDAFGEGPCAEAAVDELIVRTEDFRVEQRWPRFSREAAKRGVRSGLSFKLYTGTNTAGALNLFAFEPSVFDSQAEATGSVLAAHAAAAILASRRGEHLESALASRDVIGQAKGIIMERFKVDAVRAFELLRELSQTGNTKLVKVAQGVVDTARE
jgi:GAF domain-containing protein